MKQRILQPITSNLKPNKGFIILFTVLICSVILAIAIGISNIAYKEIILTSSVRDSQYAFSAADTGAECALYYDALDYFGTQPTIKCNGIDAEITSNGGTLYEVLMPLSELSCVKINVEKDYQTNGSTSIESRGYNVSCDQVLINTNPRIVERAIQVIYGIPDVVPPIIPPTEGDLPPVPLGD
ncbi:MAG: hypothetical protein WDK96_02675 [Candidatus Paceibacterota bacterium]|jgi:hypothetical protein